MNCPSRPDAIEGHPEWNQNPHALSSELTTRADLNGIINLREQLENESSLGIDQVEQLRTIPVDQPELPSTKVFGSKEASAVKVAPMEELEATVSRATAYQNPSRWSTNSRPPMAFLHKARAVAQKYVKFVGPGFLIAVAYIDPGNYATDVEAGASTRYKHLFIVLMSNSIAIFLQSLCIKLGSVTGLNLAENCRKHLPRWLTIILYLFAEAAIIATDIAEVISIHTKLLSTELKFARSSAQPSR